MINDQATVTYLYVDASNLWGALSDLLPNGSYIDFKDILNCIEEDFYIHKVKAYGTYLTDEPKSAPTRKKFIGAQHKFFRSMASIPKVDLHKGYFSVNDNEKKEKGIDVKMAVDMLKDSYEESYKCGLIMSGDDDFLYAIECVRNINIPVHLTSFGSRFPYGIAHNVNHRYVYDLFSYFKESKLPEISNPPVNLQVKDITDKVSIINL